MKIELDKLTLGISPLTDTVYAGVLNPAGKTWRHKKDVSDEFIACAIERWNNQKEEIEDEKGNTYVISCVMLRECRVCGCTENNCQQCIEKTGSPCHWVEADLCSACVESPETTIKTNTNGNEEPKRKGRTIGGGISKLISG